MAWPFGNSAEKDHDEDAALTEDRLKIMANVAIEQVPLPEEGELGEEDAWNHLSGSYQGTPEQHWQCAERGS